MALTLDQIRQIPEYGDASDDEILSIAQSKGIRIIGYEQTPAPKSAADAPRTPQKNAFTDTINDIGIGALKVPGALTGLADIPLSAAGFDRPVSRAADAVGEMTGFQPGKLAESEAQRVYSPERMAANQRVDQTWNDYDKGAIGLKDAIKATIAEPRALAGNIAQSLPSMAAGGALGKALKAATTVTGATAAAAGEGAIMAGQQMDQINDKVDPQRAAAASAATGIAGAILSRLGGKAADELGIGDFDVAMVGGEAKKSALPFYQRAPLGAMQEGLVEELPQSLVEQANQNAAEGAPLTKGLARAGVEGALSGGAMGGAFNAMPQSSHAANDVNQESRLDINAEQQSEQLALPAPTLGLPAPSKGLEFNRSANMPKDTIVFSDGSQIGAYQFFQDRMAEHGDEAKARRETYMALNGKPKPVIGIPELVFTADGSSLNKNELIQGFVANGATVEQANDYIKAITQMPVEARTETNLDPYYFLQEQTQRDQQRAFDFSYATATGSDAERDNAAAGDSGASEQSDNTADQTGKTEPVTSSAEPEPTKPDVGNPSHEAPFTHADRETGEQYRHLGGDEYQDANGDIWNFNEGELEAIKPEKSTDVKETGEKTGEKKITSFNQSENVVGTQNELEQNDNLQPATQPKRRNDHTPALVTGTAGTTGRNDDNVPEQQQVPVSSVLSGNDSGSGAVDPILDTKKTDWVKSKIKERGIRRGSPGYAAKLKEYGDEYETELNKALARLPFEDFVKHPEIAKSKATASLNRQVYDALRDEYGITDEAPKSAEPVNTPPSVSEIINEPDELVETTPESQVSSQVSETKSPVAKTKPEITEISGTKLDESAKKKTGVADSNSQAPAPEGSAFEGVGGNAQQEVGREKLTKQPSAKKTKPTQQEVKKDDTVNPEMDDLKAQMGQAIGELASLLGGKMNLSEEEETKLLPIMSKIFRIAAKMGYLKFQESAGYVMQQIRELAGDEIAEKLSIKNLQAGYLNANGEDFDGLAGYRGKTLAELETDYANAKAAGQQKTKDPVKTVDKAEPENIEIDFDASKAFAKKMLDGESFSTIVQARKALTNQEIKPGTPESKQADEAIELAGVLAARKIVDKGMAADETFDALAKLAEQMPSLNVRTSTSVANQAYSTPLPLAWIASVRASIDKSKTVVEPTAGNGALVIAADPDKTIVNELNPDRAEALRKQGFKAHNQNAVDFDFGDASADVVIANPPFGVVKDDAGNTETFRINSDYSTNEIDHAISLNALKAMKDGGKAVLIVGGPNKTLSEKGRSDAYNGKAKRAFYYTLYNAYNVTDHFTVSGDLYAKQGAAWPVDVIVIEGRGKSALKLPAADLPRIINSVEELKNELKNPRNGLQQNGETAPEATDQGAESLDDGSVVNDERVGATGRDESGQSKPVLSRSERRAGNTERGSTDAAGQSGDSVGRKSGRTDKSNNKVSNQYQAPYTPASQSNSVDTLVPVNMKTAIEKALKKVSAETQGDIDQYVADLLDYPKQDIAKYFSAEQVDAIALALNNIEQGKGFIIGDQTGVGKGRVNAAMIRYAIQNKMIPIFVTEKPNLYGDMIRDLNDIGMADIKPLATNSGFQIPIDQDAQQWYEESEKAKEDGLTPPPKYGKFIATPGNQKHADTLRQLMDQVGIGDYDVIFTTYNQMQTVKGAMTDRMNFLKNKADGGLLILDESHNAGGTELAARKGGNGVAKVEAGEKGGRAGFVRSLVNVSKGTFYSSATYAKRPDVLDLYSKTDMGLVANPDTLKESMAAGGVPLQQAVASMLAESGQYIRREKSFDGINYDTVSVNVNKDFAEKASQVMREIMRFDQAKLAALDALDRDLKADAIKLTVDRSTGGAGATTTNFTSVMHNMIGQMLLMLKTKPAIDEAIAALQRGEKPVIALSNTMGSAIDEYVQEAGLNPGDAISLNFGDLLKRYLSKSRRVTEGDAFGKKTTRELTDAELGPAAVKLYKQIQKNIDAFNFAEYPVSPIDYIHHELEKAGYKSSEITGRGSVIDYSNEAMPVYRKRDAQSKTAAGKRKIINDFNNGKLDVIILNQSGATGLSLHASPKVGGDTRKRHMIIAQAENNIDTHMQMLGRINRTGQISLPSYAQLVADIPAEKRPAAILAKKMAMLNANTTAGKDSAVKAKDVPDFMNQYGDEIAAQVMNDNRELHFAIGKPLSENRTGDGFDVDGAMRKVTGRIPVLSLKDQESLYAEIESAYNEYIDMLTKTGQNALEAQAMDLDAKPISSQEVVAPIGDGQSPFAKGVNAEIVNVKKLGKPYTPEQIKALLAKKGITDGESKRKFIAGLEDKISQESDKESERIAKMDDSDEKAQKAKTAANDKFQQLHDKLLYFVRNLSPGSFVTMTSPLGLEYQGIVGGIERKGDAKSFFALGQWKATIYVADPVKQFVMPLSKLGLSGLEGAWSITRQYDSKEFDDALADGLSTTREDRTILTGNMLSAYGFDKSGQIVNYTTHEGKVVQGVLMPKRFNLENAISAKPVVFDSPAMSLEYVNGAVDLRLAALRSANGEIKIAFGNGGGGQISVPASKSRGGQYYLNPRLTKLLGDFFKRGGEMVARFSKEDLPELLRIVYPMSGNLQPISKESGKAFLEKKGIKFSKGAQATGSKADDVKSWLPSRVKMLVKAGKLKVVQSISNVPDNSQSFDAGDVEGFYDESADTLYLVADNITRDNLISTLNHELFHRAEATDKKLRAALEKFDDDIVRRFYAARDGKASPIERAAYERVMEAGTPIYNRISEFKAYMISEWNRSPDSFAGAIRKIIKDFIAAIRAAMIRAGMSIDNLTPADLNALAMYGTKVGKVKKPPNQSASKPYNIDEDDFFNDDDDDIRYSVAAKAKAAAQSAVSDDKVDHAIYNLQDRYIDLKRQMQKVVKNGGTITETEDAYMGEELSHQRIASRIKDFYDKDLTPILQKLHKDGISMDTFQKFLHARHAPSRNAVMAERNPNQDIIDANLADAEKKLADLSKNPMTPPKALSEARREVSKWERAKPFQGGEEERLSLSGMSNREARDFINSLKPEERRTMELLGRKIDAINNATLDLMVAYKMETPDTIRSLKEQWEHYVPLHRDEAHPDDNNFGHPIGRGFSVRGSGLKNATGSNAEVTNILAHIAAAREQMIKRGEKNNVTVKLANFIHNHPDTDFAELGKVPMEDKLINGLVESVPDPLFKNRDNALVFRFNGKDHAIIFNDNKPENIRLAMSLKNMDGVDLDKVERIFAFGTRWLASVNTQYNVVFGLTNLMRDTSGMALNLTSTELHGKQGRVLSAMKKAIPAIAAAERNWKKSDPAMKAMYERFNKAGGTTGYAQMFENIKDRDQSIRDELKKIEAGQVKQSWYWIKDALTDFNTVMENSTRLAVFMVGVESGLSDAKAASIAKNITVNFNRKGAYTTKAGAFYAFFNASMQGTARLAETMKGPQGKRILLSGVALGAALTLLGIASMGADEWEKIPEFVRERSLILSTPWTADKYVAIPMPLGFHVIPNIGRKLVEAAFGSNRVSITERFTQLAASTIGAFNPFGGGDISEMLMPTILDPAVALWRNKDWTGHSIYKEDFNSLKPTPGFSRTKDSASWPSKAIAEGINKATGGTDYKQGFWSPTPDQLDFVFGQLFGGTGREILKASQTAESLFTGEELPTYKVPLFGKLYGEASGNAAERSRYYDNIRLLNEHNAELDGRRKNGESLGDYLQENPEARLIVRAKSIQHRVDALQDQRKLIMKGDPTPQARRAIDDRIAKAMKELNDAVIKAMD